MKKFTKNSIKQHKRDKTERQEKIVRYDEKILVPAHRQYLEEEVEYKK